MQHLKGMKIWLCWRHETVKGRRTKVPYGADGKKAGTDGKYSHRWVMYENALEAAKKHGFDGVGLVIPPGYGGIDEDHRDSFDPLAVEIRERLDTYEERSPSGTGQHLLFQCDLSKIPQRDGKLDSRYYAKNPHNKLEIYFGGLTNRFFTYTGDVISDKPVADCTEAALWFLDTHMQRARFKKEKKQSVYDPIATARKAKNGDKFIALYDNGDTSGYCSDSEADLALCNALAFFTGGNEAEIDRLFRQSKLYREKWERDDYREATIQKAVLGCNGRFDPAARPMPPYLFYNPKTENVGVSRPLLAKFLRENLRYLFVRDSARGGVLRYVYEDGGVYALYSDDMLRGVIKGYITSFDETILRMGDVGEVFQQLSTDLVFVDSTALNADEGIINFHNGVLQLDTLQLRPHSPDYLSTVQIPCEWKGEAQPTPVFDAFMRDLTEGRKDIEKLLLQFMGVCLSNIKGWRLKKALFLVGKGDTGKSQLKSLTERLLGKGNYVGIDLKELEARFGTGNIYMKRLAGSADMSFASIDEVKVFKKTTGGDSLFAEFKGQNGFEFVYDGILWFCMNRLPKFGGDNGRWVYNRIMVVECNNVIPPEKQDKRLLDKLYAEREGIVYKAVMALREVITSGYAFNEPQCVVTARADYQHENSTVISFWSECMEKRPGIKIHDNCTTGKVYDVYKAWCADNNHGYSKTAKEFRTEIAEHLNKAVSDMTTRRAQGMVYKDYTLTNDAKQQYAKAYGYDGAEFLCAASS
ncbi:MAG: hypothetical protein KGZ45_06535 [Clostridium sp.]|nr:hypothetical protein [Clostridium sp.]